MAAVVNRMELGRELSRCIIQLNQQIEAVKREAKRLNTEPSLMRDERGAFLMTPLIVAKAQALHGLALINQKP